MHCTTHAIHLHTHPDLHPHSHLYTHVPNNTLTQTHTHSHTKAHSDAHICISSHPDTYLHAVSHPFAHSHALLTHTYQRHCLRHTPLSCSVFPASSHLLLHRFELEPNWVPLRAACTKPVCPRPGPGWAEAVGTGVEVCSWRPLPHQRYLVWKP